MKKQNTEQQVQVPQQVFDEMVECINDARSILTKFLVDKLEDDVFDDKASRTEFANALAMIGRANDLSKLDSHETE